MSGANLTTLRSGMRDAIAAAIPSGLNVYDFLPDGAVPMPAVIVADDDPLVEVQGSNAAGVTFGSLQAADGSGFSTVHLRIYVIVAKTIAESAQIALDELCSFGKGSTKSVPAAIETYEGASNVVVQTISGMRQFAFNATQSYAGREIHCYVVLDRGAE